MTDSTDDLEMMIAREEAREEQDKLNAQEIWDKYQRYLLKWRTKDGDGIFVHLMTTSHVINTKKMMERNPSPTWTQRKWIEIFRIELIKRQSERK